MEHLIEIVNEFLQMMCAKASIPRREGDRLLNYKSDTLEILVLLILFLF